MNAVRATWTRGQILPTEPINWPEGSELRVEPVVPSAGKIGMSEEEWGDDPASIAAWIAAVEKIEPLEWREGEQAEYECYREKCRQFNVEAVRQQMATIGEDDGA